MLPRRPNTNPSKSADAVAQLNRLRTEDPDTWDEMRQDAERGRWEDQRWLIDDKE